MLPLPTPYVNPKIPLGNSVGSLGVEVVAIREHSYLAVMAIPGTTKCALTFHFSNSATPLPSGKPKNTLGNSCECHEVGVVGDATFSTFDGNVLFRG